MASHKGGERIQKVMFLRHGVAKHNLRDPLTGESPDLHNPSLWDPSLVQQGMQQALAVGERLSDVIQQTELVVASPLTRCLQTAHLVFFPGTAYQYKQQNPTPILCLEQVREAYGMHYPDKRRDKSFLQKHWPFVHFDPAMTETDEKWSESCRETLDDVVGRVTEFFQWLVQQEQTNIFVVSHGVWIECCFRAYFPLMLKDGRRVHNCDVFVSEIVSKDGKFVRMQNLGKI